MWIDITAPLYDKLAEWPGDTPFTFGLAVTKEESGSVNIGKMTTSTHMGTHIDAPFHFDNEGPTTEALDINRYIGTATVIELIDKDAFTLADLQAQDIHGTILLIKTTEDSERTQFPNEVPTLETTAIPYLKECGIKLFGVDVPSVDKVNDKQLSVHHTLYKNDVMIIENVVLSDIEPGIYDFIALPLKIVGGDGSLVRAVIRKKGEA